MRWGSAMMAVVGEYATFSHLSLILLVLYPSLILLALSFSRSYDKSVTISPDAESARPLLGAK